MSKPQSQSNKAVGACKTIGTQGKGKAGTGAKNVQGRGTGAGGMAKNVQGKGVK